MKNKPECFVCMDKGISMERIKQNEDRFGKNYYAWFALHCDNENCKAGEKQKYNNEKSGYYTEPMSKYLDFNIVNEANMDKWDLRK